VRRQLRIELPQRGASPARRGLTKATTRMVKQIALRECGGSAICEHGRQDTVGSAAVLYVSMARQKAQLQELRSSGICEHDSGS
jgi:hypothetical protein